MILENNQLIDILISGIKSTDGDVAQDISYSYSTVFDPLYSTPNKVRAVAGSYIKDISDQMLLYLIHTYSVEADNIALCTSDKWQYFASLWVTYNTALNAIYNSSIYVGEAGQKIYKKLGDFAISKDASGKDSNPAKDLLDKLECDIFKLSVAVKNCKEPLLECTKNSSNTYSPSAALGVMKGGDVPRPFFGRTFLSSGRHPAWTGMIRGYDRHMLTNYNPASVPVSPSDSGYQ